MRLVESVTGYFQRAPAREVALGPLARHPKLWHRLLGRRVSESGRLCHGDGAHGRGGRRRRAFVLTILCGLPCEPQPDTRNRSLHRGEGERQHRDRPLTRAILRRHGLGLLCAHLAASGSRGTVPAAAGSGVGGAGRRGPR
jgi:hypothetical protein